MAQSVSRAATLRDLSWTGTARIYADDRVLDLGVSTHVVPFKSARSDTWLLKEGPSTTRSMIIAPNGGWLERNGKRDAMPDAMLRHERQQFAIYGLMQMALAGKLTATPSNSPDVPETQFIFDASGHLAEARNQVDDPEGGGKKIRQVFRFSGQMPGSDLTWPRRIDILQDGRPYFTLELDTFRAEGH